MAGKAIQVEKNRNSVNANGWFIGNPYSAFQKDLTDFVLIR